MPMVAMGPARSDDMKVSSLSNLNKKIPPKGLCEKPNTVLKGRRRRRCNRGCDNAFAAVDFDAFGNEIMHGDDEAGDAAN